MPAHRAPENIVIISGPAGSGKDSLIDELGKILPLKRLVTTTSRAPRPGEQKSIDYFFIDRPLFEQIISEGRFIEYSINENNEYYGLTHESLERARRSQGIFIWKPEWKGVMSAKQLFPEMPAIFITAPLAVLEARLRKRDQHKDETYFTERMAYTHEWLKHLDLYDYTIENREGELEKTVTELKTLLTKITGA